MEAITTTTTAVCLPSPVQLALGGVCLGLGIKLGFKAFDALDNGLDAAIAKYKKAEPKKEEPKKEEPKKEEPKKEEPKKEETKKA